MGRSLLSLMFVSLVLNACAVATLKKETSNGGRVQVSGPGCLAPSGVKKAEEVILKKCPGGYEELERGEENTGSTLGTGYGGQVAMPAFYMEFKCKGEARLPNSAGK